MMVSLYFFLGSIFLVHVVIVIFLFAVTRLNIYFGVVLFLDNESELCFTNNLYEKRERTCSSR